MGRFLLGVLIGMCAVAIMLWFTGCTTVSLQVGDGNKKEPVVEVNGVKVPGKEK